MNFKRLRKFKSNPKINFKMKNSPSMSQTFQVPSFETVAILERKKTFTYNPFTITSVKHKESFLRVYSLVQF